MCPIATGRGSDGGPWRFGPETLARDIVEQWTALDTEVGAVGGAVSFVKPHGALYHRMGVDPVVAAAVVVAVHQLGARALVAQAGTLVADAPEGRLRVVPEGFPDRGYLPRRTAGAPDRARGPVGGSGRGGRRAVARSGAAPCASDGTWTPIEVETLCIHGDSAGAAATARSVRAALDGPA